MTAAHPPVPWTSDVYTVADLLASMRPQVIDIDGSPTIALITSWLGDAVLAHARPVNDREWLIWLWTALGAGTDTDLTQFALLAAQAEPPTRIERLTPDTERPYQGRLLHGIRGRIVAGVAETFDPGAMTIFQALLRTARHTALTARFRDLYHRAPGLELSTANPAAGVRLADPAILELRGTWHGYRLEAYLTGADVRLQLSDPAQPAALWSADAALTTPFTWTPARPSLDAAFIADALHAAAAELRPAAYPYEFLDLDAGATGGPLTVTASGHSAEQAFAALLREHHGQGRRFSPAAMNRDTRAYPDPAPRFVVHPR